MDLNQSVVADRTRQNGLIRVNVLSVNQPHLFLGVVTALMPVLALHTRSITERDNSPWRSRHLVLKNDHCI